MGISNMTQKERTVGCGRGSLSSQIAASDACAILTSEGMGLFIARDWFARANKELTLTAIGGAQSVHTHMNVLLTSNT